MAKQKQESQHWEQWQQRLSEGLLIMVSAIALFLLIALMTYHANDPGLTHTGIGKVVHNAGGVAGAYVADILLLLFGYIAYLVPLFFIQTAWQIYRRQLWYSQYYWWLKGLAFILIITISCALVSLHSFFGSKVLPAGGGGIIGTVIAKSMLANFNRLGTTLILVALLLTSLTLFTNFSWIRVPQLLVKFTMTSFKYLKTNLSQIFLQKIKNIFKFRRMSLKTDPIFSNNDGNKFNKVFLNQEDRFVHRDQFINKDILTKKDEFVSKDKFDNPDILITKDDSGLKRKYLSTNKNSTNNKLTSTFVQSSAQSSEQSFSKIRKNKNVTLNASITNDDLPPLSLLDEKNQMVTLGYSTEEIAELSKQVELRLLDFGVQVKVVGVHPGPVVTRFELQLAAGTKVSRINNLAKDLARSLLVTSVRIVDIIPGKSVIGLELPNAQRDVVRLTEIIAAPQYTHSHSPLTLALGKDIAGHAVVMDIAKMPHLLVAGTTGAGKSVCLNAILLSLLYKATAQQLRLIMIDPKMLELSIYEGIPHLLAPVVTDMKEAASALRWCVGEMDRRYRLMAALKVRNLAGYNFKIEEARRQGSPLLDPFWQPGSEGSESAAEEVQELPAIVVIADEFADMMMVVGKKVEELIARIAQKARAAGIHLVLATQRPSVDVITGLIKANIPTRIAFQVSSKIDSRTILDQSGAEQLLGYGDMLYLPPGSGVPIRIHGAFVADEEVHRVVEYLKQRGKPDYIEDMFEESQISTNLSFNLKDENNDEVSGEADPLYDQAVHLVAKTRRVSISSIQRRFKIGYNRAARIVEAMEAARVVSSMSSNGARDVLIPQQD